MQGNAIVYQDIVGFVDRTGPGIGMNIDIQHTGVSPRTERCAATGKKFPFLNFTVLGILRTTNGQFQI